MFFLTSNLIINTILAKISSRKMKNYLGYFLVSLVLSTVSGLRYFVGTDFYQYSEIFRYPNTGIKWHFTKEPLFEMLLQICRSISDNPQIFFLITSFFINSLVIYTLFKYSKYFYLSVYYFITTFIYYSAMNGVRQYMASTIVFASLTFIFKGEKNKYLSMILLASLMHKSALILLPVYYFVRRPVKNSWNLIYIIIIIISFIAYKPIMTILFIFMPQDTYGHYADTFINQNNGANLLRIIVWTAPIVVGYLYRTKGMKILGRKYEVIFNFCLLGWGFIFLALREKYFARVFMYFDFYYLLLIPIIPDFYGDNKKIVKIVMMILYYLYSTLLLLSGESWIYPFRMTLNIF